MTPQLLYLSSILDRSGDHPFARRRLRLAQEFEPTAQSIRKIFRAQRIHCSLHSRARTSQEQDLSRVAQLFRLCRQGGSIARI